MGGVWSPRESLGGLWGYIGAYLSEGVRWASEGGVSEGVYLSGGVLWVSVGVRGVYLAEGVSEGEIYDNGGGDLWERCPRRWMSMAKSIAVGRPELSLRRVTARPEPLPQPPPTLPAAPFPAAHSPPPLPSAAPAKHPLPSSRRSFQCPKCGK